MKLTSHNFQDILKEIISSDTSSEPNRWTKDTPFQGHCAVVALLAQDYFGGDIIKGSLKDFKDYTYLRSHFWNRLSSGEEVDFTHEQFKDISIKDLAGEVQSMESVLNHPDTIKRYSLLKERFEGVFNSN